MTLKLKTPSNGSVTLAPQDTASDVVLTVPATAGVVNTSGVVNQVPAGSASAPSVYPTGDANTGLFFPAADAVAVATGGAERYRVDSSGNLLVGTTDPGSTSGVGFKVLHSATIPGCYTIMNTAAGGNSFHLYNTNATNNGFRFYVGVNGGIVNYSGNNVNLSDQRMKTDIEAAGDYLQKICAIPVRTFRYKDQGDTDTEKTLGVIAQEVEAIAPELVNNDGFGITPDDGVPLKTIYQTDLQYALMKCIQEQQAIINSLQDRIAALENA